MDRVTSGFIFEFSVWGVGAFGLQGWDLQWWLSSGLSTLQMVNILLVVRNVGCRKRPEVTLRVLFWPLQWCLCSCLYSSSL